MRVRMGFSIARMHQGPFYKQRVCVWANVGDKALVERDLVRLGTATDQHSAMRKASTHCLLRAACTYRQKLRDKLDSLRFIHVKQWKGATGSDIFH